jgi:hypothetical protein
VENYRVVIFQEKSRWIAQCLEYDVASDGETILDAIDMFIFAMKGNAELAIKNGDVPFSKLKPAPQKYFDLYEKAVLLSPDLKFPTPWPSREVESSVPEFKVAA